MKWKIKFHGSKPPSSGCFLSALGNGIGIRLWFPQTTQALPMRGFRWMASAVNPEVETKFEWYKPPNIGTL